MARLRADSSIIPMVFSLTHSGHMSFLHYTSLLRNAKWNHLWMKTIHPESLPFMFMSRVWLRSSRKTPGYSSVSGGPIKLNFLPDLHQNSSLASAVSDSGHNHIAVAWSSLFWTFPTTILVRTVCTTGDSGSLSKTRGNISCQPCRIHF